MASGFNANGSIPKPSNSDLAMRNRDDQVPRDYVPRVSQRKLFRAIKWKDIPNEGYQKRKYR